MIWVGKGYAALSGLVGYPSLFPQGVALGCIDCAPLGLMFACPCSFLTYRKNKVSGFRSGASKKGRRWERRSPRRLFCPAGAFMSSISESKMRKNFRGLFRFRLCRIGAVCCIRNTNPTHNENGNCLPSLDFPDNGNESLGGRGSCRAGNARIIRLSRSFALPDKREGGNYRK